MLKRYTNFFFIIFFFLKIQGFSEENRNYKIYDCFPFFNELDILEIRLNELYDYVDKFVIVESNKTFTGLDKPLFFLENKDRFLKFQDKIIHVSNLDPRDVKNPWVHDGDQKNYILKGLINCNENDIIIASDCDEILRGKDLEKLILPILENKTDIVIPYLGEYLYFFNRYRALMTGPIIMTYKTLIRHDPYYYRLNKDSILGSQVENNQQPVDLPSPAGWHFSSMGWLQTYLFKLKSYAHTEANTELNNMPINILKKARKLKLVEIDDTYPECFIKNIEYYRRINFLDEDLNIDEAVELYNTRQSMNLYKYN